jgi:hypothetical protein
LQRIQELTNIYTVLNYFTENWKENALKEDLVRQNMVSELEKRLVCLARGVEADRHMPMYERKEENGLILR